MSEYASVSYRAQDMSLLQRIRYELVRRTFIGKYRQPFYETLRFLLENKKSFKEALSLIGEVHTDFGRRWHPYSELVEDCLEAIADNSAGHSLPDVLAAWVPREEAALISAGIRSGSVPRSLEQADKLIVARRRILGQVLMASVYPILLLFLGAGLLTVNNWLLIPTLSKLSSPDSWTGALGLMNHISAFTSAYGGITGLCCVAFIALVFWSLPRWRGSLRRFADRLMPWSIYKDLQGAVFLMNVSALLEAGVPHLDAVRILHDFGSPWLQERLEAVTDGINNGVGLGKSLRDCGYQFPSQEAANYLSILGQGDGASRLISNYANRWLEQVLGLVARRANVAKLFSLFLIITFFLLMLGMVMQIQDMTQYSPH
ncbi:pilus assembly protein PilR [Prodigiosinella confusarubida]|uniref:Pilus assembly protein PilR n=1 Tax=Serratia sp. (strain ATCC 39006) TaxID=104623 RepID=A0A2I5TBF1_SERS3|nr:type II secretion system F family protein [Serratia sp. ATCC 39006]AUH01898.1 pilus assembly protein PilR [Serratia sp. ATCC 39006]AUH06220.1 pilus assembly protein PilR [Serratia sp. ATCC 39006]